VVAGLLAIGYGVLSPEPDGFHSLAQGQGLVSCSPDVHPGRSATVTSQAPAPPSINATYRAIVAVSLSQSAQQADLRDSRAVPIDGVYHGVMRHFDCDVNCTCLSSGYTREPRG
jgi:hypothetical protein